MAERMERETAGSYSAALVIAAVGLPLIAAVATVIAYIAYQSPGGGDFPPPPFPDGAHYSAIFTGALVALAAWALLAFLCRPYTRADRAQAMFYDQLASRYLRLRTCLDGLRDQAGQRDYALASAQATIIGDALGLDCHGQRHGPVPAGLPWVQLTRYNDLFGRLHSAEQALIAIERREDVVAGAIRDTSRLDGSSIPGRDSLLVRLRRAIDQLDPAAAQYLDAASKATGEADPAVAATAAVTLGESVGKVYSRLDALYHAMDPDAGTGQRLGWCGQVDALRLPEIARGLQEQELGLKACRESLGSNLERLQAEQQKAKTLLNLLQADLPGDQTSAVQVHLREAVADIAALGEQIEATRGRLDGEAQARTVLRDVRTAINTYRNDIQWGGLLRVRNQVLWLTGLTGLAAYMILALAILRGASLDVIIAATTFYLVGATTGLLSRLFRMWRREEAGEDYGLGMARVVARIPLSGLAAVGGVLLTAMIPALILGVVPQPTTPTPTETSPPTTLATQAAAQIRSPLLQRMSVAEATATAAATEATYQPALSPPALNEIFSLTGFPFGLVYAAVFGLLPELLLRGLNNVIEEYKKNLTTSDVSEEPEISSPTDRTF